MKYILNKEQQDIVQNNLHIIRMVINKCININKNTFGMEYDDIFQVGTIGLCKAVITYFSNKDTSFETYAFCIIRNEIYNHLNSINRKNIYCDTELIEKVDIQSTSITPEEALDEKIALEALRRSKERYSGVTLKGIEALELKLKGYSGTDIAKMYKVKPNYIAACISRAIKYLRKDKIFSSEIGK